MFCGSVKSQSRGVPSQKPKPHKLKTQFGQNIVRLRVASGQTQEVLAERIGVSVRYFQSVEAGEYFPSLPVLQQLARHLDCDWNALFAGLDGPK